MCIRDSVGLGRKVVRAGTAERLQRRLDVAGNPAGWDVSRVIGTKVLGAGVLGALGLVWSLSSGRSPLSVLAIVAAAGAVGYVLPNILLHNAGQKRESLMQRELPDSMALLTISVEAGLGFDAAVHRVAQQTTGPLSQELHRLIQEMQLGVGRTEAMRAMAERTTLADLRSFCLAMVQADQLGVPVGKVLRIPERQQDAVTAISGSGPAYIFFVVESMIEAGVHLGLPRATATDLVIQTLVGSGKMLRETGTHPTVLREQVTSPGGTTASALRELEVHKVRAAFLAAMEAARDRSRALAQGS